MQFSTTFTATINITYPAGSTCTATNGSTTLTAPDTTGKWACKVAKSGTWTITVKNKWSDTVSVTASGSSVSLDISKFWLYQPGNTHSNRTGGWKTAAGILGNYTQNSVTFGAAGSNGATLALKTGANASCYMQTSSAVDLSNFTKLIYVFTGTVASKHGYVSSKSSNPDAWDNKAAGLRDDTVGTKTIDISALSGSYYIYLGHFTSSSFVTAYVKEVYLQ